MKLLLYVNLILGLVAASPAEPSAGLTVVVRDAADRGLAGVQIVVRAAGSHAQLASGHTDAAGSIWFGGLPPEAVRVAVRGALPDGTPLSQAGADADGVLLLSGAGNQRLDLRVEPSGRVIPDPVTMIAPDLPENSAVQAAPAPALPRSAAVAPARAGVTSDRVPAWLLPFALCCVSALLLLASRRSAG